MTDNDMDMFPMDLYGLTSDRSVAGVLRFLDHFLPKREKAADEYEYPQYSDNGLIYQTALEVMALLEKDKNECYGICFHNAHDEEPYHCFLYYTNDNALALGLVVSYSEAEYYMRELKAEFGCQYAYVTGETPAADNAETFKAICMSEENEFARMVEGKFYPGKY